METILQPPLRTLYIPSLAVPGQTVVVHQLSTSPHRLDQQDLLMLQQTAIPNGQQWTYTVSQPDRTCELLQVSLYSDARLSPNLCCVTAPLNQAQLPQPPSQVPALPHDVAYGCPTSNQADPSNMTHIFDNMTPSSSGAPHAG